MSLRDSVKVFDWGSTNHYLINLGEGIMENQEVKKVEEVKHRNKRKYAKPNHWFLVPFWMIGLIIVYIPRVLILNPLLEIIDWLMNVIKIVLGAKLITKIITLILSLASLIGVIYVVLRVIGRDDIITKVIELFNLLF